MMTRSLLIGVLLLTSSVLVSVSADSSSEATTTAAADASPTTPATPAAPVTSPTAVTSDSPASPTAGSPTTVDPNAPTQPTGASTSAAPGGSSAAPSGSSVAPGSSAAPVSSGPTTTPPLPDVTVSLLQFSAPVCDDTSCLYQFAAPGNDQAFLATENSLIASESSQYSALQSQASQKDADIKKANDDAQQKLTELQTLLNNIQSNINLIQGSISTIKNQQTDANAALGLVQKFINDVNSAPDNCLYQRCLKPTTPAPPTTTPTPAPTTPPSPCVNFTCPGDAEGTLLSSHCKLDSSNQPSCDNCLNNFDGYNHCTSVACNSAGTGFVVDSTKNTGVLYSTGYNTSDADSSVVPASANCRWNLIGSYQATSDGYNLSCLTSGNVAMTVLSSDGLNQKLINSTSLRSLNAVLKKITDPIFTLTSTSSDPTFCSIPLTLQITTGSPPTLVAEKKNGFFSWLMGN